MSIVRPTILEYVRELCADSKRMVEVKTDLKRDEPHLKVWTDKIVNQAMSRIKSKHNLGKDSSLETAIERELYSTFFHGLLTYKIETENILHKHLDIPFNPSSAHRPEYSLKEEWQDGMLSDEFYKEDPSEFPKDHLYVKAYAKHKENKKNRKKMKEVEPLTDIITQAKSIPPPESGSGKAGKDSLTI